MDCVERPIHDGGQLPTRLQGWTLISTFRMTRHIRRKGYYSRAGSVAFVKAQKQMSLAKLDIGEEPGVAYITLPVAEELGREFPGIVGPMTFRPETAAPINELVNILLRGESTLTRGERELIATHVSWRNDCFFCQTIHGAVAAAQLGHDEKLVQSVSD